MDENLNKIIEKKFYLRKIYREPFMIGLEYIINRCYSLKEIFKENSYKFIPLEELDDQEFFIPYKLYDGNDELEKKVYQESNFKNFTLLFESFTFTKPQLEKIINDLILKGYIYPQILPLNQSLMLPYLTIKAKTKNDKIIYFELIPGKIKYKIEENNPIFFDTLLLYLSEFNKIMEEIEGKVERDEIFGSGDINREEQFNKYFLDTLEKIYSEVEEKYNQKVEEIDLEKLSLLQEKAYENAEYAKVFEKEFEKLLEAIESGKFEKEKVIISSKKWTELKDKYNSAWKIYHINPELYNKITEIYHKYKAKEIDKERVVYWYSKFKKDCEKMGKKLEKELVKEFLSEVLNEQINHK